MGVPIPDRDPAPEKGPREVSTFTEDLQRRLRAVLSLRVQAPLPADIPIEVAPVAVGDVEGSPARLDLELRTTAHPFAAWPYEAPDAWGKLLADLAMVPDGPAVAPPLPPRAFVRVKMLTNACPSQWYAWDELDAQYYLRYRWGRGTVEAVITPEHEHLLVRDFKHGDELDGVISLDDFARLAGIDVSKIPEADRT